MGQGLPGAGGSPPSASPTRPRAVGSTPQLTSARGHAVGDHGRAGHGVEAVLSFVGTHVALQSLGWGPGEGGGGHRAGGGALPCPPPPPGQTSGEERGSLGFLASLPPTPTPCSLPAPKGPSIHPSYPQAGPPGPPATGRAGAPWLEARGQRGGGDAESGPSSIQHRPGLEQGPERVGQAPALPERLIYWRRWSPAQRRRRRMITAGPEGLAGGLGRRHPTRPGSQGRPAGGGDTKGNGKEAGKGRSSRRGQCP